LVPFLTIGTQGHVRKDGEEGEKKSGTVGEEKVDVEREENNLGGEKEMEKI
jgi:hypothetical protein